MADPISVVFMGTSDFGVPSLLSLDRPGVRVLAVVTQPDRPAGRGLELKASAVKKAALGKGWKVLQPVKMGRDGSLEALQALSPDYLVVAAYGQILPKAVLQAPKKASLNVHGSLLPRWRGAAPIHYAVMSGDLETGVTLMHMNEKMDEGDMVLQKSLAIGEHETTGELHDRLAPLGAQALGEALDLLESGKASRTVQDPTKATYAPSLKREHCRVDWNQGAKKVADLIRGLDPWPSAEAAWGGEPVKLYGSRTADGKGRPGEILGLDGTGLTVATGEGAVRAEWIQPPGKRRMKPKEFSLGHPDFRIGATLT